ncbi:hypothetical protein BJX65DRAFT_250432 [Aspergillus insuetus]
MPLWKAILLARSGGQEEARRCARLRRRCCGFQGGQIRLSNIRGDKEQSKESGDKIQLGGRSTCQMHSVDAAVGEKGETMGNGINGGVRSGRTTLSRSVGEVPGSVSVQSGAQHQGVVAIMRREGQKKVGRWWCNPLPYWSLQGWRWMDGIAVKYYFQGLAVVPWAQVVCLVSFSDGARMIKQISCDWTHWSDVPHAGLSCRRERVGGD